MSPDSRTVTIAFALVMGAGMATAIGAAVVIVLPPKLLLSQSQHSVLNRYVLASSLGMSAGVMIYVSMIEIFQKARTAFIDSGYEENIAYVYATLSFFAGVMIMMVRISYCGLIVVRVDVLFKFYMYLLAREIIWYCHTDEYSFVF